MKSNLIKRKNKYYVYDKNGWIVIITRSRRIAEKIANRIHPSI